GLGVLLLGDRLPHFEADALELFDELGHVGLLQVVLNRERLELGRFDPAALLPRLQQGAGALGVKQFVQLALSQVGIDVLWFLRLALQTFPPYGALRHRARGRDSFHANARCRAAIPPRPLRAWTVARFECLPEVLCDCEEVAFQAFFFVVRFRFGAGPRSRRGLLSSDARSSG